MIIAIDPGKQCGWALWRDGDVFACGAETIECPEDMVLLLGDLRCYANANDLVQLKLVYERAVFHPSKAAAEAYGWRVGAMHAWAALQYPPVEVKTVNPKDARDAAGVKARYSTKDFEGTDRQKKSQARRAGKRAMILAARKQWPDFDFTTADQADAAWIAVAAYQLYGDLI